jgi:hypothetical protein
MERISGSLALAISEHRLGDALYALLLGTSSPFLVQIFNRRGSYHVRLGP